MTTRASSPPTCAAFRQLPPGMLQPDAVHRLVLGEDDAVRVLSAEEAAAELGDPFATHLLLRGVFPRTAGDVLTALDRATPVGHPLREELVFLLGEGSQLPTGAATAAVDRRLRFLVTRGVGAEGADVLLSAAHPGSGDVELMAWDRRAGGFNFYQSVGDSTAWVFAGNSRHALRGPSQGRGPFESHLSGTVVMKELRSPWLHWHSQAANVLPSVLPADPPLVGHPWVTARNPQGADICELAVARPGIDRWTRARFKRLVEAGVVDDPGRVLVQVLDTPSVNIIASNRESRDVVAGGPLVLPQTFFVDSEALTEVLGLPAPPRFAVAAETYLRSLRTFDVHQEDDDGARYAGDAHFAFAVPERAFEDQAVLRQALATGLLSDRLAACLLMVDFPNPVFSPRRAALLAHVPPRARISDGSSDLPDAMADAILAAAPDTPAGSPEREFAELWDDVASLGDRLRAYYAAVTGRLGSPTGFDDYVRLADSRRRRVRQMPVSESSLLFARTNVPPRERRMTADGTVVEV
ncbi:hypothetical protein SAMN06893096_102516 [Geodermatophilus pulveris]|uniref:Uncharacterized protein n=1 Tax=Geodermatophilus pulveris TaxID=1564159 RepID=A0A239CMN6_9ACTN|nr:hypothetical protein [Geodermatophilus pulveris]SNS20998.1 hypothetical protein SAMN06893096_102516 [Geodermatophilus pulveris]